MNDQQKLAFMEANFSHGWTSRLELIFPDSVPTIPLEEYMQTLPKNLLNSPLTPIYHQRKQQDRERFFNDKIPPKNHQLSKCGPHQFDHHHKMKNANGGGNTFSPPVHAPLKNMLSGPQQLRMVNGGDHINNGNGSGNGGGGGTFMGGGGGRHAGANGNHHQPHHQGPVEKSNEKYKTTLCNSYTNNGTCKYGLSCLFAHGYGELRRTPRFNGANNKRPPSDDFEHHHRNGQGQQQQQQQVIMSWKAPPPNKACLPIGIQQHQQ